MNIEGNVWVLTGAGSGIGRALGLAILNKGGHLAAVDMREENLQKFYTELPKTLRTLCSVHVLDIGDKQATDALPEEVIKSHGRVNGLINNAGIIQAFVKVQHLSEVDIQRVMQVNFFGTLNLTRAFLPYFMDSIEAHIVNISSMGGFVPVPGQTIYGASKAAVKLFTEGLGAELEDTGIEVSLVYPGAIETNITQNSGVHVPGSNTSEHAKKFKALPAAIAAATIIKGIERNKKRIWVGKDSKMMDLFYRLSPSLATGLITKQMKSLLGD